MSHEQIRWTVFTVIALALLGWRGRDLWQHWDERIPRCEAHLETVAGERIIDTSGEGNECDEPIGYVDAEKELVFAEGERGSCSFDNPAEPDDTVTASRTRLGFCHDTGRKRAPARR